MNNIAVEKASDVAANLAHLSHEFTRAKEVVGEAIETGKHKAERMVKQATVAAEDFVEDTTYYIKRHPWQAVGVAAALGAASGMLLSLLLAPLCTRTKSQ